jgi:hypothetical protein
MIIIRLRSGLGNQMFQYAFFKQMQFWHGVENVKLDISTYHWNIHNGLEINKIFNINFTNEVVPRKVSLQYADVGYQLRHRILRRLRGRKHHAYMFWKNIDYNDYKNLDNVYIEGYWNEERYFKDVKDEIRKLYTFRETELSESEQQMLNLISSGASVGIHVRRGDYKKYPDTFPMCSPDYYAKSRDILEARFGNLQYFIFSDEIDWCKNNLDLPYNTVFMENRQRNNAYKDMLLMSRCKHNIIANSTFSWWAAWLNTNAQKMVTYPESALITYKSMPEEWIAV